MNAVQPYLIPILIVVLLSSFAAAVAARRALKAHRAARRRVELPNSHYTSQLVRETEKRHRWQGLALDGLHEINRQEVSRLLAKLDATSTQALKPHEVTFLDRMAELAGAGGNTALTA